MLLPVTLQFTAGMKEDKEFFNILKGQLLLQPFWLLRLDM